ncbi:MAG TPA: septal ring lytic transglycosylase RlpA family protein [Stellaceae bacterium]|nr:septal ring lytic transglycosylase RlpA family protein [Stellaceae bacterium]
MQVGLASWYGPRFHGNKTADGERFDMNALTAAHRTLPFNTYVRVTDLANGRSVVVRINDRGPYDGHRVIDLSARAARELGMTHYGTARVRIELVKVSDADAVEGRPPVWAQEHP